MGIAISIMIIVSISNSIIEIALVIMKELKKHGLGENFDVKKTNETKVNEQKYLGYKEVIIKTKVIYIYTHMIEKDIYIYIYTHMIDI